MSVLIWTQTVYTLIEFVKDFFVKKLFRKNPADDVEALRCLVMVERLFLAVLWGCLQFVIVVFPDHTHFLFKSLEHITIHSGYLAGDKPAHFFNSCTD